MTKKSRYLSKSAAQKIHAKNRSLERFNLDLTRKARVFIREQIRNGRAVTVEEQSLRVTLKLVTLPDGRLVRVIYDKLRHNIVTFMHTLEGDAELMEKHKKKFAKKQQTSDDYSEITKEFESIFKDEE